MEDEWAGVAAALDRFGLPAKLEDRSNILVALQVQIRLELQEHGDQDLMRLLCAQLFSLGVVEDSLSIWQAKSCSFDAHMSIPVHYLCGAGYEQTKTFLSAVRSVAASAALDYIATCEPDFKNFSIESVLRNARGYFHGC